MNFFEILNLEFLYIKLLSKGWKIRLDPAFIPFPVQILIPSSIGTFVFLHSIFHVSPFYPSCFSILSFSLPIHISVMHLHSILLCSPFYPSCFYILSVLFLHSILQFLHFILQFLHFILHVSSFYPSCFFHSILHVSPFNSSCFFIKSFMFLHSVLHVSSFYPSCFSIQSFMFLHSILHVSPLCPPCFSIFSFMFLYSILQWTWEFSDEFDIVFLNNSLI